MAWPTRGAALSGLAVAVLISACGGPSEAAAPTGTRAPGAARPSSATSPVPSASGRQTPSDYGRLVLADGDHVRASGRVVSVPHRPVRLCAPVAEGGPGYEPGHEPAPEYCSLGIDVSGVNLRSLDRRRAKDGAVEGYADLEGVYRSAGSLAVTAQRRYRPDPGPGFVPDDPPCPAPKGGWPAGGDDANLDHTAVETYGSAHPGSIVMQAVLRPSRRQVLMYALIAGDPAPVEAALRPTYGAALCVMRSRYTRAEIDRAAKALGPQAPALREAGVFVVGSAGLAGDEQEVVDAALVHVTPQVAALAASQPAGLVRLHPWLHPESVAVNPMF